jgi:hypothetical protein
MTLKKVGRLTKLTNGECEGTIFAHGTIINTLLLILRSKILHSYNSPEVVEICQIRLQS